MGFHEFLEGEVRALNARGINEETCRKFGYKVGKNKAGETVQIAEYRDAEGTLVAQKIRGADKKFSVVGGGKNMPLFGQHLWSNSGRRVVVTEGEIDALSVAQAFNLKWAVVSLPNGASSAKASVQRSIEWLEGYDEVVFCFDMDEPGQEAAVECAALLTPGRAKIAALPLKDANELTKAGREADINTAVYQARVYRPDGIVSLSELRGRVMAKAEVGLPYFDDRITEATFGRRMGEIYCLGAGTGVGKTDWLTQQVAYDVNELNLTVGCMFLEQGVAETGRRVAGKMAGKRFHVPDGSWTQEELEATWSKLEAAGKLHLYDSFGATAWENIKPKIRYMAQALKCQVVVLDNLTALAAAEDDERTALERIMSELAGLANGLKIIIHFVSHLATPEGKSHEEGGRVMIRHMKGSRAIGFWSHGIHALERDQQADDPAKQQLSTFRVLKDRFTGQATGKTFGYRYDAQRGLLIPADLADKADAFQVEPDGDF